MRRPHLESNVLILVTLALVAFGVVMVYSATSAAATLGGGNPAYYVKRQAIYALLGLALLVLTARCGYWSLRRLAPMLVAGSLLLLLLALAAGSRVNGASRWLRLGPVTFQPSELAKPALAVWLALYLARRPAPRTLGELARPVGLLIAVFCALVLAEPDLGTVITICVLAGALLLVAGAPVRMLGQAAAIVSGVVLIAIWLEPYRRSRIFSFVNPWHDAQGAGYQTVQAMVGLGSGGIFGRGLGESVQKVFYLPEAHTDMIFAIIGEELVCGQALLNLAAVVGMAPLTGIPLPLVSYGGTSLVVMLASVGVLLNIARSDGVEVAAPVRDRSRRDGRARAAGARRRRSAARPRRERQLRRLA